MKLRTKVVLIAACLTFIGLAIGLAATYTLLIQFRIGDLDADNEVVAELIWEVVSAAPTDPDSPALNAYLLRPSGAGSAQVFLGDTLLWAGGIPDVPMPLDPLGLASGGGARTVNGWRVLTLVQGGTTIQVGRPLTSLRAIFQPFALIAISLTALLTALSARAAWVAGFFALRPIETLAGAAESFGPGAPLPQIRSNDEAATLLRAFAKLMERLRAEHERELRFIEYAAHELRTPISALRATLEDPRLRNATTDSATLTHLQREARRLERLAGNLLALSRAEARVLHAKEIDLAEVAAAAYDRFQPLAVQSGREVYLEGSSAPVRADAMLIDQALNNLIINAIVHGPPGSVTIATGVDAGSEARPERDAGAAARSGSDRPRAGSYIDVIDEGSGMPDPLSEGLGLRVARAVVRAHGGDLIVGGVGGTVVRLWLPLHTSSVDPDEARPG